MGVDKWKKVIAYLNKVKADPDKVYRLLETANSKGRRDNNYQMIRASWKIDVVARIFNKFGTTKKNKIPLIAGGVFPTFAPDICIKHDLVDLVCVGEGENALVDLCKKIDFC